MHKAIAHDLYGLGWLRGRIRVRGTTEAPPLAEQLCFDLYAASRAVTAAYRPVLTRLGITCPQYLVLIVLWEHDSCTVRDLAARLRLDHGTLTPLLKRMEVGGLVERRRDNSDERFVLVSLAARGESLRQHAEAIHCDMVEQLGLMQHEFEELQETLRVLQPGFRRPNAER